MSNFRQQYVARCVGGEREANRQDVNKLLDSSKDYDLEKVREFSWMFSIPPTTRRKMWKVLLQVLPEYRENDERVISSRLQEAEILFNCLKTTRELECFQVRRKQTSGNSCPAPMIVDPSSSTRSTLDEELSDSDLTIVDQNQPEDRPRFVSTLDRPSPVDLSNMILLAEGMIHEKELLRKCYPFYPALCEQMLNLCHEKWADAFHLSRKVLKLMAKTFGDEDQMRKTLNEIHDRLAKEIGMNSRLCERTTFAKLSIRHWLLGAGALIIHSPRALQRFWDKLLTGEACRILMIQLIVEFLVTIDKRFGDDLHVSCDYRLTEEGDMRLVKRVLDEVAKSGGRKSMSDMRLRRVHNIL